MDFDGRVPGLPIRLRWPGYIKLENYCRNFTLSSNTDNKLSEHIISVIFVLVLRW